MQIEENFSLKAYNTFGIDATARYYSECNSTDSLVEVIEAKKDVPKIILGGGSNILFTKNFDGLVLKNNIDGISLDKEDEEFVYIKAGAGVNWHELVMHCVDNNYGGMENLSLIPGNVGATPMQNIGAYGVEIKNIFHELEALNLKEKTIENFQNKDCEFGYRESVFKKKYKEQFVILNVTYKLKKNPLFNISYGPIKEELEKMNIENLSIRSISDAIINIRKSKLPNPEIIGNAGSFFKNPVVKNNELGELRRTYSEMPFFKFDKEYSKLPAGWLIEKCGWKGYRNADAGCYEKQALVLVNYGNAKGSDIYDLSEKIKESVYKKFSVVLEREVNII